MKFIVLKANPSVLLLLATLVLVGCQRETKPVRSLIGQKAADGLLPVISPRHIRELRITGATLTEDHWKYVGEFHLLEELTLRQCDIDGQDLTYLTQLVNLKKLVIRVQPNDVADSDMNSLVSLTKLEQFELGSKLVTDVGLAKLANHENIEDIRLSCPAVTGSSLASFSAQQNLKNLELYGCATTDNEMQHIARFRYLRSLWLGHTEVTDAGLMLVSNNLWLVNVTPSPRMTDEGLLKFRQTLIVGRQQARKAGIVVPPDDLLFINTQNKKVRGKSPVGGQSKMLDQLQRSIMPTTP